MTAEKTYLSEAFAARARDHKGGHIHFLLDGSNVATEGYMFERADTDPVTHALETVLEIRDRLPQTEVTASFWSTGHPDVPINLNGSPASWYRKIPKGAAHITPALRTLEEKIDNGALKTPLQVVAFLNMGGADGADNIKEGFRKLNQKPGVDVDVIILSDVPLGVTKSIGDLAAEEPAHPVGSYRILTPDEYRAALRDAVYGRVEKALQAQDKTEQEALHSEAAKIGDTARHGTFKTVTRPKTAHFRKNPAGTD